MGEWARPAVRLHPVHGSPGVTDSHIGGALLWPADEPWPWCDFDGEPFVGAVQLYQRDFPELPFPDGTDLLQVFLCTLGHEVPGASGPLTFACPECGEVQCQVLSLGTHEPSGDHVEWVFGKYGNLNVFLCRRDVQHPIKVHID